MDSKLKVIGFDADDTLWINEPYYREVESEFVRLMAGYQVDRDASKILYETEIGNLPFYGYGIKSFVLSLVQSSIELTNGKVTAETVTKILDLGKGMLNRPIELLDDVKEVLEVLYTDYKLIVATKGDLLDQENKMKRSSISSYFHHIEVMTDKREENYIQLLNHLDINPCEFLMIGNSLKSDIIPPLNLGSYAVHVPFHTTWEHEEVNEIPVNSRFYKAERLKEIPGIIADLMA